MERIDGRVAFVTGAASGIGLAITEALVAAGARVAMTDWDADRLDVQATRLGDAVVPRRLDVTDRDGWADAATWIDDTLGPVEILVNNAGVGPTPEMLVDTTPETFDRMVAIKLTGTFNGVHAFGAGMRDRGEGHIVNTASMAGLFASPKLGAYTAAKFGVVGMSEVLRAEMSRHGVGVSVLCPGLVRTNLAPNMDDGLDPALVGGAVIEAIRRDDLYVITHPEHRPLVAERTQRLLDAFDR